MSSNKHRNQLKCILAALLATLVSCLFVNALLVFYLAKFSQLQHIFPSIEINAPGFYDDQLRDEEDREKFRKALNEISVAKVSAEEKVLMTLRWLMNEVGSIENVRSQGSWEMIELARAGRGFGCGAMAQIFHDALISIGIPARRVILQRDVFDIYDSHTTVEVNVDGEWRVYDPTFHIALVSNDKKLGVLEAQQILRKSGLGALQFHFLGEVRYPARLEEYPVRYGYLLDNVFFEIDRGHGYWRILPLIGVITSPQWAYYPVEEGAYKTEPQNLYQFFYYFSFLILPTVILLLFMLCLISWRRLLNHETSIN